MNEYATLAQFRAFKSIADDSTADDAEILRYLGWASRQIDKYCRRVFYPKIATLTFDYQTSLEHYLDRDMVELTTLTVNSSAVSSSNYKLYPLNDYPKYRVAMNRGTGSIFSYTDTPQGAISIAGIWGYHDDWDNAWLDTGDSVQDASLSASVTTVTLDDVDGVCVDGLAPRVSPGSLIKIDSEYMQVTATVDDAANTATVRRGVNGSTAATHATAATIYVYQPATVATMACLGLTKWIYEMKEAYGGIIALPTLEGTAIEAEVKNILGQHGLPVRNSDLMGMTWQ